ncbi:hypothetical protein P9139_10800 [Curtobacterium flaccumfaciens]|nr:hypothetical protein P9139_10800 [Curtobacterium flaccumfaciens]
MDTVELLILLIGSLAVTGFARAKGLPAPLLVTAVALAASFLPGLPAMEIDSEVILTLILPRCSTPRRSTCRGRASGPRSSRSGVSASSSSSSPPSPSVRWRTSSSPT